MRAKRVVPLVVVGGVLSICAVAARAPGAILTAYMATGQPQGGWPKCGSDHDYYFAEATAYDGNLNVVCRSYDAVGASVHTNCSNSAAFHRAILWSADGWTPVGVIGGTPHCTAAGVWWPQASSCTQTVSVKPAGGGPCFNMTFTAYSQGQ